MKTSLRGLLHDKRALFALAAVVVLAVFYLRSRSSSASTVTNPNAIDPATGLTYAAESVAAQQGGGVTFGGGAGGTPTADQVTTANGTSVAAALEGLGSGLTAVQTALANEAALLQSQSEAAAQLTQQVSQLTSLGAAGPTVPGPSVVYNAPVNIDQAGGDTVYQAPVTIVTPPPPASSSGKNGGQSAPPKATTPAKPPTVSTRDAVSANNPKTHT